MRYYSPPTPQDSQLAAAAANSENACEDSLMSVMGYGFTNELDRYKMEEESKHDNVLKVWLYLFEPISEAGNAAGEVDS